jgi:hypothetical protein
MFILGSKGCGILQHFRQYFSCIVVSFIVRKLEKTKDLQQVTDKLFHIMFYLIHLVQCTGLDLTTLVVTGMDCICCCISNYNMIMTTTVPYHRQYLTEVI